MPPDHDNSLVKKEKKTPKISTTTARYREDASRVQARADVPA